MSKLSPWSFSSEFCFIPAFHTWFFWGNQLKGELSKCSVGTDLPQGHALRKQLDSAKAKLEDLLEEFLDHLVRPFSLTIFDPGSILGNASII